MAERQDGPTESHQSSWATTSFSSVLTEVAWCAIRFNPHFKALYDRVRGGSKSRKKQAIIAVARKILVTAWAMLRDGKNWSPPQAKLMVQADPKLASASTA